MIYGFTGPPLPRDMRPYGALTLLVFYSGKGRGGPLLSPSEPLRVPRILLDPGLPLKALEKVTFLNLRQPSSTFSGIPRAQEDP